MNSTESTAPDRTTDQPEQKYLLAWQVAERLGVTHRWVMDKAASGHLPCVKLPGSNRIRFIWADVEAALTAAREAA